MHPLGNYIFKSARLGFRNWEATDIDKMADINQDKQVMAFFPAVQSKEQTASFVQRMQEQFRQKGFCYFAVDKLDDGQFIGFIGCSEQTYPAPFTPCVDIGWRLGRNFWNQGYATEGAKKCIEYFFEDLGHDRLYAVAPKANSKSEAIMLKIGMNKLYDFDHPLLMHDERLRTCVVYEKNKHP